MCKNPCILAVDDEPSILRVLQQALEPAGFDVIPALEYCFVTCYWRKGDRCYFKSKVGRHIKELEGKKGQK